MPTSTASSPAYSTSSALTLRRSTTFPYTTLFRSGLDKVELYAHTPGIAGYALAGTDSTPDTSQSFAFAGTVDGSYSFYTVAYDKAGNVEAAPAGSDSSTLVDTQDPTSTTTSPANSGSNTPTGSNSAAARANGGTASDLLKDGSASGLDKVELSIKQQSSGRYWDGTGFNNAGETWKLANGTSSWSYSFTPPADGQYTVHSRATDNAGRIETSFDVSTFNESNFTSDTTKPDVTIEQASGQSDPTDASPINFTVVFNESVTGLTDADVTLSGSAGATIKVVTGTGTTYNVAVSGMASDGTVIASIPAGGASDAAGNTN